VSRCIAIAIGDVKTLKYTGKIDNEQCQLRVTEDCSKG